VALGVPPSRKGVGTIPAKKAGEKQPRRLRKGTVAIKGLGAVTISRIGQSTWGFGKETTQKTKK